MKYIYPVLAALLLTGCIKSHSIEFTGTTPGINSGVFIVKTITDSAVYGENIKNGKFKVNKKVLQYPGYYLFNITDNDHTDNRPPFEIYLEPGSYHIETQPGKLYEYPKVTSSSKTQDELSAFYTLSDKLIVDAKRQTDSLNNAVKNKSNGLSKTAFATLLNELAASENKMTDVNATAFKQFVKEHPNSLASTHLMAKLNYQEDPLTYYTIYKTLTTVAQNTDDGKEVGDKLKQLVKLVEGAKAPQIYGKMPDGKAFDPKSINKPLILIDFWRASNDFSRQNHKKLITLLEDGKNSKNLAIISISLDTKADWWTTAVAEDNMTWPQVSDLKGDDSPNAANWSISELPTYYLLNSDWKIVKRNIDIGNIDFELSDYLSKHH